MYFAVIAKIRPTSSSGGQVENARTPPGLSTRNISLTATTVAELFRATLGAYTAGTVLPVSRWRDASAGGIGPSVAQQLTFADTAGAVLRRNGPRFLMIKETSSGRLCHA